jgi:Flp pilus assembly pilin Flp
MYLVGRDSGQNVVEYGLLIASIVVIVLIGVTTFGHLIQPCSFPWQGASRALEPDRGSLRLRRRTRMDANEGGGAMRGPYGIVGLVVTIIIVIVILRLLGLF